ncbi:hypothetical protein [Streptosporangium sp. V21-05]|uniref:hypothetical protein n=1 Tax=Streptosporangium sp. V21-05 TaxID=3446115 RepID=UPI003F53A12A
MPAAWCATCSGRANEHRDQRVIAADHVLEFVDGARLDGPYHWEQVLELGHALALGT